MSKKEVLESNVEEEVSKKTTGTKTKASSSKSTKTKKTTKETKATEETKPKTTRKRTSKKTAEKEEKKKDDFEQKYDSVIDEMIKRAKENNNVINISEMEEILNDDDITGEIVEKIYDKLESQGIEIPGREIDIEPTDEPTEEELEEEENVDLDVDILERWSSWERAFHHSGSEQEWLRNYRMQIYNRAKLFGCNEVIICSDQGPSECIYDNTINNIQ